MAESVNFNMSQGIVSSQGFVVHMYQQSGDEEKDALYYFISGGKTYQIIHHVTLNGLKEIFPTVKIKSFDWEETRAMLEKITQVNMTP